MGQERDLKGNLDCPGNSHGSEEGRLRPGARMFGGGMLMCTISRFSVLDWDFDRCGSVGSTDCQLIER